MQDGDNLKPKTIVLTMLLCLTAVSLSLAQSPQMGTWKLNEAKSHIPAG